MVNVFALFAPVLIVILAALIVQIAVAGVQKSTGIDLPAVLSGMLGAKLVGNSDVQE